ncbi:hypothetical protein BTW08_15420, partial [Salinicola sp. MH3R3-1]|uniref:tape measure protein n=1 Tax=Salinicola sp. MH3R3-1 TaxID=1928762 RepID=UPI00095C73F9
MANDLQLKVTLRGDGRHLSGTLRDASGEVREFGSTSDRSGRQSSAAFDRTGRSVRGVNREVTELNRISDLARNSLLALGGAISVREVISYSDAWTNTSNQIRTVTDSNDQLIASQQRLLAIANESRTSYESTANLYARLTRATTKLNLGQERTYRLVDTINKSFAVSGATAEEASAAIVQLSQGLAAGALRGDEFNSVSEQAPAIMYAIADSLNMTLGELREFAASGGITAEIVVNALEKASASIDETFGGSIASFGQKMAVARNQMVEWVGTSDQVSGAVDQAGDAILGLVGHMDELVAVGTVLATIYGGRVAGALASSAAGYTARTVATIRDTQAQREASAAEAGRQLALARTAAAEKTALANNAALAARRALTARQDAANNAANISQARASLVAERELEAQRLKAQISATGRQRSVARLAELRTAETTITRQLSAANATLAESEAAVTSASRAATVASAQQTAATRAATTAQGAYTGAMRASTAAAGAMATAARGASAALALIGGPVGAALIAVGALYAFREELGLVSVKANETKARVDQLTGSLDGLTQAQIRNKRASLVQDLVEARIEAEKLQKQFAALEKQNREQMITNQGRAGSAWFQSQKLSPQLSEAKSVVATLEQGLDDFDTQVARLKQSATSGVSIFRTMDQWLFDVGETTDDTASSVATLTKSTDSFGNSLQTLRDRLDPVAKSQREYLSDQILLQTAWAGGKLTLDQYLVAVGQLDQLYRNAGDAAQEYGFDGQQAARDVKRETTALETALTRSVERMDDAFVDFWENTLSGAKNTFQSFKDLAISTLAEIIHAYTTRKITASLGTSLAGTGTASANGASGGFGTGGMDLGSLGKTIYQGITDGFGAINWTGAPTGATSYSSGFGSQVATGGGQFGGSLSNFSGMNGVASLGAGYVGSQVGTKLGSSVFGKDANSAWGSTIGAGIGTYFGGPLGALAGGALGGVLDSAFGSSRTVGAGLVQDNDRAADDFYGTTVDGESWSQRDSKFGQFGLSFKTKMDPDDLATWLDGLKDIDNELARAANDSQVSAVRDALDGQSFSEDGSNSISEITEERVGVIIDGLKSASSDAVVRLIDNVGDVTAKNLEEKIPEIAAALQLGNFVDGLTGNVRDYAERVVAETTDSIDQTLEQLVSSIQNFGVVSDAANSLNLRFNTLANNAIDAADSLVKAAGGIEAFQAQTETYYQAFYTEQERVTRQTESLNEALKGTSLSASSSRDEFRAVVESLNLNSSAGRETYSTLMSVAGSFADLVPAASDAASANDDLAQSDADRARAAAELAQQRNDLEIQLLEAQGRTAEATKRRRQDELESLDGSLTALQKQIYAQEDANEAAEAAADIQERYASALSNARDYLAGAITNIDSYLDQLKSTSAGAASPADQLAAAGGAFREQLEAARGGDREALNSITQYADRYMSAQRNWSGSGGETATVIDRIETALSQLPEQLSPEQFLSDEFAKQIAGQTDSLATAIDLNGDGTKTALKAAITKNLDTTSRLSASLVETMRAAGDK